MSATFVILQHTGHGADHYDWLFDRPGRRLPTWQLAEDPAALPAGAERPARRLPDHRREYLTYEGPVNGARGRVRRVRQGIYELLEGGDGVWRIRCKGPVQGTFAFARRDGDAWRVRRVR